MAKRNFLLLMLVLTLLCSGCAPAIQENVPTEETAPAVTVPPDGNPADVTCKGSYTAAEFDPKAVAAQAGDQILTNEELQVWYWMEVAARQQDTALSSAPDYSQPLDTQPCPNDSVNSWQQYFLKRALNTWHSVCALELQAREEELPLEEAYQPDPELHERYMTNMPAAEVLYGYAPLYQPNTMHEAYLDALPDTLEKLAKEKGFASLDQLAQALGVSPEAVTAVARMYNYSYMYFTTLSYSLPASIEETIPEELAEKPSENAERAVTFRQILLIPEEAAPTEEPEAQTQTDPWEDCLKAAKKLVRTWERKTRHDESAFADLAYRNTQDLGSALDGGAFRNIRRGMLPQPLEDWCFDESRQPGDVEIIQTELGWHILYFSSGTTLSGELEQSLQDLVIQARRRYPAEIQYRNIALPQGQPIFSPKEVLYPDIAHERFPEIPLYLQRDYPGTMYGGYKLTTNGCGITSMAMVASYFADDELTPPEMCARFGRYSHHNGTDGMIFNYEPAGMGFFLREKTYDPKVAKAALQEGQIVISVQHAGIWTSGGHYIVLEAIDEEGLIQVRDSNIFNYGHENGGRVRGHTEDRHTWGSITSNGSGFWIFEDKVTRIPMCSRCGQEEDASLILNQDYLCGKCTPALLRRNAYLTATGELSK